MTFCTGICLSGNYERQISLTGPLDGGGEVLLDEDDAFVGQFSLGVDSLGLLDEDALASGGLEVLGEDSSALGDDGGGLVVLKHLLLELFGFLGSLLVELGHVLLVASNFSLLLLLDASENLSSGVKVALELSL